MDPLTVSMLLSAGSSILDFGAQAQSDSLRFADLANNAELARIAAGDAEARGRLAAGRVRMKGSRLAAAQRVAWANSGVVGTTGTPLQVAQSSQAMNEWDALTIENDAAREAWGLRVKADQLEKQTDKSTGAFRAVGAALGLVGKGFGIAGQATK